MNAKHLGLVLFLTLAAGVATAAIKHADLGSPKAVAPSETAGQIPRIVVTAKRPYVDAGGCETTIPRVVVVGHRVDAGPVAAAK